MASAGMPGTGVGGLFYVVLALWMPVRELYLAARGRSDRDRRRAALRQGALGCGVVAAVGLTVVLAAWLGGTPGTAAWLLLPVGLLTVLFVVLRLWARLCRGAVAAPRHRQERPVD